MASKRKAPGEGNYRERKKQKMATARAIAIQLASGPSTQNHARNDQLPTSIDVERFTEARAFEISAMENAIKNSSSGSTQRAWQALPRSLRRRAASHDARRVPVRLRERARGEMDTVKPKKKIRKPQLGKDRRLTQTEKFLKRQRDKTWLETHIWHTKRMHMETMWGYRLAITPTEKSFRPSHRASMHGSIIHDASYYATIELKGPEKVLSSIFETSCDPRSCSPGAPRFRSGSRIAETTMYKHGSYPFDLLGPASVLWKPLPPENASNPTSGESSDNLGAEWTIREIWLRCHPEIYDEVFESLKASASAALIAARRTLPEGRKVEIELADLRDKVLAFDIMGPQANQVLRGALKPVSSDDRDDFKKFWSSLGNLQTSAACPSGIVIGFSVIDPRLNFPPNNAKPQDSDNGRLPGCSSVFPSALLAQSNIWEDSVREKLQKPRYKKSDLDKRRSKNLTPGTKLNPLRDDDRIPCLLVQRSVKGAPSSYGESPGVHGWTLLLPAGWGMAFWPTLIHTNTRVGGQRECRVQSFEAGTVHFPHNYPFTNAYDAQASQHASEEREKWERTPPAKKPNYAKLGTRSPWMPDWDVVLGIASPDALNSPALLDGGFVTTQRDAMEISDPSKPKVRPWLLQGPETNVMVDTLSKRTHPSGSLLYEINKFRGKRNMQPLDSSVNSETLIQGALVNVRLKMVSRGKPDIMAALYEMSDEHVRKRLELIDGGRSGRPTFEGTSTVDDLPYDSEESEDEDKMDEDENPAEKEVSCVKYPQSSIIGYVTSGNFSLSRGEGFAIGSIPLLKYISLRKQSKSLSSGKSTLVALRNREGSGCRAAYIELAE